MGVIGDRQLANLLSALAEAPDSSGALSFLVSQIAELIGSPRVCVLRIDAPRASLEVATHVGL
ncbi:MAG TPA: hypothetical protein VMH39_03890, partial [Gemmatimonadaceae bacterium]|nr:hypothetical protein [Gemmatimonadaceae bacterium]